MQKKNMTTSVQFRDNLSHYLNLAAYGNGQVIIMRRGKPIAKLIPVNDIDTDNSNISEENV